MSDETYLFAVIVPFLAIVMQVLSPFRERYLGAQAAQIASSELSDEQQLHETATSLIKASMAGMVSLTGIVPTLVSFLVGCVAVFVSVSKPLLFLGGLLLVGVCLVFLIWRLVAGVTVYDLCVNKLPYLDKTRATVFAWISLVTNLALIALATAIWMGWIA